MTDFFYYEYNTITRGHPWRLRALKLRLDSWRHFFAYRTAIVWNKLSQETVKALKAYSICSFHVRRIHEDLSRFLKICL